MAKIVRGFSTTIFINILIDNKKILCFQQQITKLGFNATRNICNET